MPGSSKWSITFSFPDQNLVYISSLPHTCYMPRPCHSSWFHHPNNIGWGVQIIKLLIM
jgi:predicted phosphohydrolase